MALTIYEACKQDAWSIAPNLRVADMQELISSSGKRPIDTMLQSLSTSAVAWAAKDRRGEIVCLFGVGRSGLPDIGLPWAVATPAIEDMPVEFTRWGIRYTAKMHEVFPMLMNVVDKRNGAHIMWLDRLGYQFTGDGINSKFDGTRFLSFWRAKDVAAEEDFIARFGEAVSV